MVLVQDLSIATHKVDLENFNRKNDFNMWKVKMEALLIAPGLRRGWGGGGS